MDGLPHQSRFRNVAGRETESQHEINVDTCIPATLLKQAKACKRNIYEVPRDDNSLFSALADQLTDATFTGQSLRDHIETFISDRLPSKQHESFLLSNPNSRQDTRPSIQDAADFLRHPIVLYRDDDNPPFFFQPNDGHDPIFQILHIGCINNKYYVSFRQHDYIKDCIILGQGASGPENTDLDEDGSDTDSENPRALVSIGDENKTTIVAPGDAEKTINLTVITRGNNNRVALNIIVSENVHDYVERMIDSESSIGDEGIHMKIKTSGIGQEEIDRAERNVIKNRINIQDNINDAIGPLGVRLSMLGLGCLLMYFRPKSWLNCRAFITGLRLQNEKYLDIFRQLLTAFQHINDSNNLTMDVKISIGQLLDGTDLSDFIRGTESRDIFDRQARTIDKTPQSFEKKAVGKKQTTTDPKSGRSVSKDDTLSLKIVVRPVGNKSSLSSTDLKKVAVRTAEQVLEFKEEADVPYIPHTKTHHEMTTIRSSGSSSGYSSANSVPSYGKHLSRSRFSRSFSEKMTELFTDPSKDADSVPPDGLGQHSDQSNSDAASDAKGDVNSDLKPGDRRHLHRLRFWKSISEKVTKLFKGPSKDADSVSPYGIYKPLHRDSNQLGQHSDQSNTSLLGADKEHRSSGYHDSDPSLLDADECLRSLLILKLNCADQREFTPSQQLSIDDPDIDGALNTMKWNVFVISCEDKQLGTAFALGPGACTMTAGHVIDGYAGQYLQVRNKLLYEVTRPIGISSIADVGVLRSFRHILPWSVRLGIDFGTESCNYIYVVGYVDGNLSLQGEKCPVLPPRDKDDGYIRFQSKLFHEGSSGSPCLVFKDGKFVVKGILVGREGGTDMPYELIAITFRCLSNRFGIAISDLRIN